MSTNRLFAFPSNVGNRPVEHAQTTSLRRKHDNISKLENVTQFPVESQF